MKYESWYWLPALAAPLVISMPGAYAVTYLTVEQAQQALFPGASEFSRLDIELTTRQKKAIEERADVRVRNTKPAIWRVAAEDRQLGWFLVDRVLGKHEFITYAVALDTQGAVRGVEILEYRETHGGEVRKARWRAQFVGKGAEDRLELGRGIVNIAGATLSCKHVTKGIRRLIATFEEVLK